MFRVDGINPGFKAFLSFVRHSISDNKLSLRTVSVETHRVEVAVLCGLNSGQ